MLGYFTDTEYKNNLTSVFLHETADEAQVRHASYTLRCGTVQIIRSENQKKEQCNPEVIQLEKVGNIYLEPGDIAFLFSLEHLALGDDVMGFTVARGILFAYGLVPENTYIDPGFSGPIYTTVCNVTARRIRIDYKMPITRLFLYRLEEKVANPYKKGASLGIPQDLEKPRPTYLRTEGELSKLTDAEIVNLIEATPSYGSLFREGLSRKDREIEALRTRMDLIFCVSLLMTVGIPLLVILFYESSFLRKYAQDVVFPLVVSGVSILIGVLIEKLGEKLIERRWNGRRG